MANTGDKLTFPPLLSDAEIEAGRKPRPDSAPPAYDPWPPLEAQFPRIAKTVRELWGTRQLDDYLDRAKKFREEDSRVEIVDKHVEDYTSLQLKSFYVGYLLPMMLEVQYYDFKA